ncbi:MAG: protein kinase domain-containing protein [Planctomycetota bacterium]|jgi:WD40 repeat protein/serine/threonine protein kinase
MDAEHKDERAVFKAALKIESPAERAAYLKSACRSDAELLARVEALLKSHDEAGSFLEVPVLGSHGEPDNACSIDGPGTRIGRYELLELIGEGGMGMVYLAQQKEPVKRTVALKIVKLGMDTKQVVARFEAERQTLALLEHPNIAHVFDAGTTNTGRPYFVMEYVEGESVTKYCDQQKLSVEDRLELFRRVCDGVHHAHQKGIIHRDIKPSNILVSLREERAVPKIIDFGIAKAITQPFTEKTSYTEQGQLLGTPEYMSPEQAEMAYQDVDTRSDIYSLGVVLYELLAGVTPFDAERLREGGIDRIQQIICEEEPRTPSTRLTSLGDKANEVAQSRRTQIVTLTRRLHRELEWIPMKAMRKDRSRRYRSASELADDIQNYLAGTPLIAGPESTVYRARKFVRKHAGSVASAALVTLAVVLGLVVSIIMGCRAEQARQEEATARIKIEQALTRAENAEKVAEEQRQLAEKQSKLASEHSEGYRRELYFKRIALADMAYRDGSIKRVRELLEECPEDLRGWEWDHLDHISSDEPSTTLSGHNGVFGLAMSPDGTRIVSNGDNKTIKVWDAQSGAVLMTLPGHGSDMFNPVSFNPDGRKIASGGQDNIVRVWDTESGAELVTLQGHKSMIRAVEFSPDGKRIASASHDKTVKLWDSETGAELMVLQGHRHRITDVVFSPSGENLVSCDPGAEGTIKVWDASTGSELMTLLGHKNGVYCLAFSPDGKKIASGSLDNTVKIWDAKSGLELMTLMHTGIVFAVSFSPDSRYVACGGGFSGFGGVIKLWDVQRPNEVRILPGHDGGTRTAVFSPDGSQIISSGSDSIKIWDLRINREQVILEPRRLAWWTVWPVSFSPDGKYLASACGPKNEMIQVWNIATGTEVMTLRGHEDIAGAVFSPDGKRIVSSSNDKLIKVWDAFTGDELMTLRGHNSSVGAMFSPDGKRIVSRSWDKTIKVWDASTGAELMTLHGHNSEVLSVALSPDGKRIVSGSRGGPIKVWDASTGAELMTLRGHRGVCRAAVSPDGKWIASAGDDGTVRIWDMGTGDAVMTLRGHNRVRAAVAFTPDSRRIISGGQSEAKVWDVATGAEVMTLRQASFPVAVSLDGKTIASSADRGIVLYESEAPGDAYAVRRIGIAARKLVDKLHDEYGLYAKVIDKLNTDEDIEERQRKLALQIAQARLWEDEERTE